VEKMGENREGSCSVLEEKGVMGLLCCGLKIARKWEKISCGLKGKWSSGWRGAAAV
jgi:hypothetical protein